MRNTLANSFARLRVLIVPAILVLVCLTGSVPMRSLLWGAVPPEGKAIPIDEPEIERGDQEYWAYQPVVRPEVPDLADDAWSRNPIDKFILQKLRSKDLAPVNAADSLALLRRVTFNLSGLPPTPEEIDVYLASDPAAAYDAAITRLLDSPTYGERWSQHWLDLVRFAETDGFEHDKVRPEAWRYRDWVIQALNDDLPYDLFLKYQLAGDEIAPASEQALLATGYLLAGPDMPDINLQEERRHNFLNAMTANVGEVFLGLRFGCAECHHHRTDPISQHDFYRFRSFFETIDLFQDHPLSIRQESTTSKSDKRVSARIVRNQEKLVPVSFLYIRGDFRRPGPELQPQFPRVLISPHSDEIVPKGNIGRRQALAEWMTRREHPLTARVLVNRIWQHHFGFALVPTPSDFGWMGESTTHQELLDWLAVDLMESGWSMKRLHRLILSSATYQLASTPPESMTAEEQTRWTNLLERDPRNRYLGRMRRQRLEGEAIRDAMLAISGELNPKRSGPGVLPPLPAAVASTLLSNQWPVTKDVTEHTRRSIYLFARRNLRMPLLEAFDKPDANLSCPERSQTTIAPQALHLLNSDFARAQAVAFAERLVQFSPHRREQIEYAYLLSLGRRPGPTETQACNIYLNQFSDTRTAWNDLSHALFNLNEFLYLD